MLDAQYGHLVADLVQDFITAHQLQPDLIAWHGHTVFHDPADRSTCQIGDGACIVARTQRPVVCQFRRVDMALGGEGAPLAPLADGLLMPPAEIYVNLGGICNLSYQTPEGSFESYDVAPCNQIFNRLSEQLGCPYDDRGAIGARGRMNQELFEQLNALEYYRLPPPKSMDNNWVSKTPWPLIENSQDTTENKMYTAVSHCALQIAQACQRRLTSEQGKERRLMLTGGGAYNTFLLQRIEHYLADPTTTLIVPNPAIVEFKEAALMALMGFLYVQGIPNVYASVTGARADHIGGCLFQSWTHPLTIHG